MVQTSTLAIATIAFTAASSLALPINEVEERSFVGTEEDLATREPNFWGTLKQDLPQIAGTAFKVASKFIREEDELAAREFEDELIAREPMDELDAREPNFWGTLKQDLPQIAGTAFKVASKFIREEDELAAREFEDELVAREPMDELDAREPNFWGTLKQDLPQIAGTAFKVASKFIREEDELAAREFEDELVARDFEDDLAAREPNFWKTLKQDLPQIAGTAFKVASKFIREEDELAAREFEEDELVARDFEDDLAAREPNFWGTLKKDLPQIAGTALNVATKFIREEDELAARDFEDDLAAREFEDELVAREPMDELDAREPNFWKTLKQDLPQIAGTAFKVASKFIREEDGLAAREYDDMIFGREYAALDELD